MPKYSLGLDYGTNSARALLVDVSNGHEVATSVFNYPSGEAGVLLDPFQHIGILSLEFHVDKLSRPLL